MNQGSVVKGHQGKPRSIVKVIRVNPGSTVKGHQAEPGVNCEGCSEQIRCQL